MLFISNYYILAVNLRLLKDEIIVFMLSIFYGGQS